MSDLLGGAFTTMGRYWKQLIGAAAAVYGVAALLLGGALAVAYPVVADPLHRAVGLAPGEEAADADVRSLVISSLCVWAFVMVVMFLAATLVQAVCAVLVQESVLGRPTTFRAVGRQALARLPSVIGAVLFTWLVAFAPMALCGLGAIAALIVHTGSSDSGAVWLAPLAFLCAFLLAPLATWLWVRYSLAPAVAVVEGAGASTALRRSTALVRGSWWRVFGVALLAFLTAGVTGTCAQWGLSMMGMAAGVLGSTGIGPDPSVLQIVAAMSGYVAMLILGQVVLQFFTTTFPQLVLSLVYVDQRIRRENLAPALARAAAPAPPALTR
ncbi:hypothetical protein [Streptomyces tsukubensis]|uniref:hypothetical protein n=1 Tax=Streptomyces tsukubensis TaxID=83656 RepID=UPI00098F9A68|nr:hypothetical protein [Streptomyces tsukubensis]QFR92994.1 hypothetical protein GBW32_07805 [Streptomyces tsukubensis]